MSDFDNEHDLNKNRKRENEYLINDLIIALAVCHNVTPSYDNGLKQLQASSPDELALVEFAQLMNLELICKLCFEIPTRLLYFFRLYQSFI